MPSASLSAIMTGVSAGGQIASGFAKQGEANSEAAQLRQNANNTMGAAERQMFETNQQTVAVLSKARAEGAASGATATSPTMVTQNEGEITREGNYAALTDLYNGQSSANADIYQAKMTQFQGSQAATAGFFDAGKTIAGSQTAKTLFDKYSGTTPPWMTPISVTPNQITGGY